MGMFQIRARVANVFDTGRFFDDAFWVDTGAMYTFVPEPWLRRIGVEPAGNREFVYADGRIETRPVGDASFRIEGYDETRPCPVVFAPNDSLFLLGATALEIFGLDVDASHKALKRTAAIVGGHLTLRPRP